MRLKIHGFIVVVFLCGCGIGVNRSFYIADGTQRDTGLTTVNGRIEIGSGCEIRGDCQTVNGRVEVGDNSVVGDLQTVNGRVTVGDGCTINGDVATVNGKAKIGSGTLVHGEVTTVNGAIKLLGAKVDGDIGTINGDIELRQNAAVGGDIVVSGKSGSNPIEVRILDGSVVHGDIRVEGNRRVLVSFADGGEVRGQIRGAEIVSGAGPEELEATGS